MIINPNFISVSNVETPQILFEDDQIIAINKPSGLPSNTLSDLSQNTAESLIKKARGEHSVFLVHRLDTGTSGVLLFAKSEAAYNAMREKFKAKEIRKFYRAWSQLETSTGLNRTALKLPLEVTLPLAHHPKSKKRMIVIPEDKKVSYRGKPIPAHTRILSIQPTTWLDHEVTELRVEILTGVMHQIRVHLKHLGYPLVGDPIYNKKEGPEEDFPRLGLHAEKIEFELDGYLYQIEAPAP